MQVIPVLGRWRQGGGQKFKVICIYLARSRLGCAAETLHRENRTKRLHTNLVLYSRDY